MTQRQEEILFAIVSEYMETGEPVGSNVVAEKYKLKVSPATIRNEMGFLIEMGYLAKEHFSAGRLPTALGMRYFLEQLMNEKTLSYMEEMEIKQRLHDNRFEKDKLIRNAVEYLANNLDYAAVALVSENTVISGVSEILDFKEFQNLDTLRNMLSILESASILKDIFSKGDASKDVRVLIGEESGFRTFEPCSVVFANFKIYKGEIGSISVIGPLRMDYSRVLPAIRCVSESLSLVTRGW